MKSVIVYIDMDNVLVEFTSAFPRVDPQVLAKHKAENTVDEIPGIFSLMEPVTGAVEAFEKIAAHYDTYILSTAPWENPSAWSDKLLWVKKYLGKPAYKRLIISHNKNLNRGDYLIDDRHHNGARHFKGELIQFRSDRFPDWKAVTDYLVPEPKH
jgi:5'(3')-deoxyribonucleotidase